MSSALIRSVDTEIIKVKRKEPEHDFLKYIQLVYRWALEKHPEINRRDLELLFFLYSERIFTKTDINKYANFIAWDKNRFYRLKKEGYISVFRERSGTWLPIYELSRKGKGLVNSIYKKLLQEEEISEIYQNNPIFCRKGDTRYTRIARQFIKKNNEEVKRKFKKRLV